jgi:hypothetical protein
MNLPSLYFWEVSYALSFKGAGEIQTDQSVDCFEGQDTADVTCDSHTSSRESPCIGYSKCPGPCASPSSFAYPRVALDRY